MKKMFMVGALSLATLYGVQAQTSTSNQNSNPVTDGTTKNSGVGNATNGSASPVGTTNSSGAVGASNGTSYGNQPTVSSGTTTTGSGSQRKSGKAKPKKNS